MQLSDDGYDLFHRAVVERDADAWAAISERYRPMIISWAARYPAIQGAGERYEDLADRGLARAWAALSPERFAGFPSLAAILAYVRSCVAAAAIDVVRTQVVQERVLQHANQAVSMQPELNLLYNLEQIELWQHVAGLVRTEAERVVLFERFMLDLPPRIIYARHPELFTDVVTVYATIRNICDRLRRDQLLRQFYGEDQAP